VIDRRALFAAAILALVIWWLSTFWPTAAGAMLGGAIFVVVRYAKG
jgi:hypothetical protein